MMRLLPSAAVAVLLTVLVMPPARADIDARQIFVAGSGFKGEQHIRTDPVTSSGDPSLVHASQALFAGDQWLAVGTYKGSGTGTTSSDCPDDFDAFWSVYVDGKKAGLYWCTQWLHNGFDSGTAPTFSLVHESCNGGTHWKAWLDGVNYGCYDMDQASSDGFNGMDEIAPSGCFNIDMQYVNMRYRLTGQTTWKDFGSVQTWRTRNPSTYSCFKNTMQSNTEFWIYHDTMQ